MRAPFSRTLFELLSEQAERVPDAIAAIAGDNAVTYADLHRRAHKVGSALARRDVRRGERVALLMNNRIEWLAAGFGAAMAGAVVVPFSTWSKAPELAFLLEDSEAVFLITLARLGNQDFAGDLLGLIPELSGGEARQGLHSQRFPKLRGVVVHEAGSTLSPGMISAEEFLAGDDPPELLGPGVCARAMDDALLLYTSGSSAYPKAVRLQHFAIIENGYNIGERQGLTNDDRVFLASPLFWSYGGANALPATFTHGATLVLQAKFDAEEALDLIERHCCTSIYTLPGITTALIRHPRFSPKRTRSLRKGLTIGTPQDVRNAAETLGAIDICNIYGASETCGNCCVADSRWPLGQRAESQGEPLPGFDLRVVDPESAKPLRRGESGLVEVKGYVTPGYSGASAALNTEAFTADGYFRTGDLGYLIDSGRFVFLGRMTEMIKKGGINISPAEVEEVIVRHPGILAAGVVGLPDPEQGEIVVAFVVPANGASTTPADIEAHCRRNVSNYKVPDRIVFRSVLPTTATGKLLRRELHDIALSLRDDLSRQP